MHEMGTVLKIRDTVERLAANYHVSEIGYVKIELGDLSDALPRYLLDLWPLGTKDSICEGAELLIEEVKSKACCLKCKKEYIVMDNLEGDLPVCPECGHTHYSIVSGDKITIIELGIPDGE